MALITLIDAAAEKKSPTLGACAARRRTNAEHRTRKMLKAFEKTQAKNAKRGAFVRTCSMHAQGVCFQCFVRGRECKQSLFLAQIEGRHFAERRQSNERACRGDATVVDATRPLTLVNVSGGGN
jgi:hypothetical protein